ncbi:MAG TPA: SRPBCC family protein [Burkholderiaceae bacterium]|nr:SRPBCC family protein [Burkholderiaceae bacterium]
MKVQFEKAFPMPASAETAWMLLQDIEGVATCMPGASISERIDAQHYKGNLAVKLGPASMSFRGEIEVVSLDAAARAVHLVGKGTDSTGSSGASMDLNARVEPIDAASCNLVGKSEVSMSGKAAAFGGRMMSSVADQVFKQFAANFAAKVQTLQLQAQAQPAAPAASPTVATQAAAPLPTASAPQARQLNGLALVWSVFKDWLRSLFSPRRA